MATQQELVMAIRNLNLIKGEKRVALGKHDQITFSIPTQDKIDFTDGLDFTIKLGDSGEVKMRDVHMKAYSIREDTNIFKFQIRFILSDGSSISAHVLKK